MPVTNFQSIVSAQTVGTADVEKLAASFAGLEGAIDRATAKSNKVNEHPGFDQFARKVKEGIENPLQAVGSAAEAALKSLGPVGVGIAGVAAVIITAGVVGYEAAKSLGQYADRIDDISIRTGLSRKEVGEFSFAMQRAGGDISSVEGVMRKLSQGLSDGSAEGKVARETLRDLGITTRDLHGNAVPTSEILLQLSTRLAAIPETANRNATAIKIMGRAALEVLPDLLELADGVKRAKELGLSPSDGEINRWNGYLHQIAEADALWEKLKRQVKEPLAAVVVVTLKWFTSNNSGPALPPGIHVGGREDGGAYAMADEPLIAALMANLRKSLPGASAAAGLQSSMLADALANQGAAKSLGGFLNSGLPGAEAQLERLKQKYDEARNKAQALVDAGAVLPTVAAEHRVEVEKAYAAYRAQADLVKELGKDEEKRLANLEKARDLIRQGAGKTMEGFYTFGEGANSFIVTGQQIAAAESRRGVPTLFGGRSSLGDDVRERILNPGVGTGYVPGKYDIHSSGLSPEQSSYFASLRGGGSNPFSTVSGLLWEQLGMADLKDGIRELNGEVAFISSSASRAKGPASAEIGSYLASQGGRQVAAGWNLPTLQEGIGEVTTTEQLNERWKGYADRRKSDEQVFLNLLMAEADTTGRLVELRAGPGGELATARTVAALREDALQKELQTTGDIAKYREASRRNELDLAVKIAELERRRLDDLRNYAGNFFDSLFQGPKGIQQFFSGIFKDQLRQVFQNAAAETLGGISPNLGLPGKLFQGTLFGKDPLKDVASMKLGVAGDGLHIAAVELMAAARALATGPSGGGGSYSSAAGTFARIMTGGNGGEIGPEGVPEGSGLPTDGHPESYNWARTAGIGTAALAGGFGVYSGIQSGGAKGAITATGSALAAAGSILALSSKALSIAGPIGMLAGIGLSFATSLFPDRKAQRVDEINRELAASRYAAPTATNYTTDRYGRGFDHDIGGNVRPMIQVFIPVQAIDSKDFADRAPQVIDMVVTTLEGRLSPRLSSAVRRAALPTR